MTQPEYEQKKRERWVQFCKDNGIEQEVNISIFDAFDQIFDRAYALGKQEKEADTVIQGWVAKDNDSQGLYLYSSMPTRGINMWNGHGSLLVLLDANLYPDLTWESEPEPVEIIIKRKQNGY